MNLGQKRGRIAGKVFSNSGEELGDFEELKSSESAGELLTGTFNIYCVPAFVLIDSGSSHLFISITFQSKIKPLPKPTSFHLSVCLPNCSTILCDHILRKYPIEIANEYFEVHTILGMDWLSNH